MSAPDLNKSELYLRKDLLEWGNYLTEEYSEVARDCIIIIEELREARKELKMWREIGNNILHNGCDCEEEHTCSNCEKILDLLMPLTKVWVAPEKEEKE